MSVGDDTARYRDSQFAQGEETVTKPQVGNPRFLDVLLKCLDRRIRLMDLGAPPPPLNEFPQFRAEELRRQLFGRPDDRQNFALDRLRQRRPCVDQFGQKGLTHP